MFKRVNDREKARLVRHMVQGTCEPRDVHRLLEGLRDGWTEGMEMHLPALELSSTENDSFRKINLLDGHSILSSRLFFRQKTIAEAGELAKSGQRVSVFSFSLTPVRHLVRYTESGVWVQTGGQFGRARRKDRVFRWCRFASRAKIEIGRIAKQRGI